MRTWRVGTISMGLTLLMLGLVLLTSQLLGFNLTSVMISWWPFILVVLGIEIIVYIIKSKDNQSFLKYDFLSIIIVGLIGTIGIGFTLLQTSGMLNHVEHYLTKEYQTFNLPDLNYNVSDGVKRIVVDSGNQALTVEGSSASEIAMFGTYEMYNSKNNNLITEYNDYVSVVEKGDTVYLTLKKAPVSYDQFSNGVQLSTTLLVPENLKLEVNSNYNELTIKPRTLKSNWTISEANSVSVQLQSNSDVTLIAKEINKITSNLDDWEIVRKQEAEDNDYEETNDSKITTATYNVGKGTNQLQINNCYDLSLTLLK